VAYRESVRSQTTQTGSPGEVSEQATRQVSSEEFAVVQHRVTVLESLPPRLEAVEKQVQLVSQKLESLDEHLKDVKIETHKTALSVKEARGQIQKLFWTGAGVFLAASAIWTVGVTIYSLGIVR